MLFTFFQAYVTELHSDSGEHAQESTLFQAKFNERNQVLRVQMWQAQL